MKSDVIKTAKLLRDLAEGKAGISNTMLSEISDDYMAGVRAELRSLSTQLMAIADPTREHIKELLQDTKTMLGVLMHGGLLSDDEQSVLLTIQSNINYMLTRWEETTIKMSEQEGGLNGPA